MHEHSTLHAEVLGSPANPTLLLLHGFMSCNAQWLLNVDALAEHYQLVLVELWGHGDSPMPLDPASVSIDGYLDQFERIRQRLGVTRWGLIGQSYGAGLMLNLARSRPEACSGVVVTNSRSAFGDVSRDEPPASDSTPADFDPRALPFHPIHARRFPDHVKTALVQQADRISQDAVRLGGQLGARLGCASWLNELIAAEVPVLLANGVYERAFQPNVEALRANCPDLAIIDLDGGHSINIEAAEPFNRLCLEFFARPHRTQE